MEEKWRDSVDHVLREPLLMLCALISCASPKILHALTRKCVAADAGRVRVLDWGYRVVDGDALACARSMG